MKSINVLIGANGAGKSNFVSVFRLLENIYNQRLQTYVQANGGGNGFLHFGAQTTNEIIIDLKLKDNGYFANLVKDSERDGLFIQYDEGCWYGSQTYQRPYRPISSNALESEIANSKEPIVDYSRTYLGQCKLYHFHDTSLTAKFKSYQDIGANQFLASFAENLAPFLYRLKNEFNDDYKNIVSAVQTIAPYFKDFDFNISGEKVLLRWQHQNDLSNLGFSAQTLSDGTARFICMATLFLQPKDFLPKTIVLDESELGLHPTALRVLAEMIKSVNDSVQIIIATQSITLANCFKPDDFIVVDYENGESKFNRINNQESLEVWLENYQMGDIWDKNLIGARPW